MNRGLLRNCEKLTGLPVTGSVPVASGSCADPDPGWIAMGCGPDELPTVAAATNVPPTTTTAAAIRSFFRDGCIVGILRRVFLEVHAATVIRMHPNGRDVV